MIKKKKNTVVGITIIDIKRGMFQLMNFQVKPLFIGYIDLHAMFGT